MSAFAADFGGDSVERSQQSLMPKRRIRFLKGLQGSLVFRGGHLFQNLARANILRPDGVGFGFTFLRKQTACFANIIPKKDGFQRQSWLGALIAGDLSIKQSYHLGGG